MHRNDNPADTGLRRSIRAGLDATVRRPTAAGSPDSPRASRRARDRARAGLTAILRDATGATAIEYGLISVLVVVGCYTMLFDTGEQATEALDSIDLALRQSNNPPPPRPFEVPPPPFGWPAWNPTNPGAAPEPGPRPGPGIGPGMGPGGRPITGNAAAPGADGPEDGPGMTDLIA